MLGWSRLERLAFAGLVALSLLNLAVFARSGDAWLEGPAWDDAYYYFSIARFAVAHRAEGPIGTFQAGLPNWLVPEVVNLDGKTNRQVLAAIRAGRLDRWLAASDINLVVDFELFGLEHSSIVQVAFDGQALENELIVLQRIADKEQN